MTHDRAAIAAFLDACAWHEIVFEPQRGYSTESEAREAACLFWERYCALHRAIGREPPAWPPHLQSPDPETMI